MSRAPSLATPAIQRRDVMGRGAAAAADEPRPRGVPALGEGLHEALLEARVLEWARRVSIDSGLQARPAKMSVELHPPISVDKGSAVKERVQPGTEAVLMIGDDVGDLSAFVAVADLEANMRALKVVVASPELDPQVAAIADITLGSPAEVVTFLQT